MNWRSCSAEIWNGFRRARAGKLADAGLLGLKLCQLKGRNLFEQQVRDELPRQRIIAAVCR